MSDFDRYARQIKLPQIGIDGQKRLSESSALIVGIGGLGSPIALYLAAAGVGHIGLIDGDSVSLSNLQRQILYSEREIGCPKVNIAYKRLKELNGNIKIDKYNCFLTDENAENIISGYDLVIDGCDNLRTRYIIDEICSKLSIPYIYGAIGAMSGQVCVFHYGNDTHTYKDLFPDDGMDSLDNEPLGVIGTTPAIIGSFEANEAIKILAGFGNVLSGTLLNINLETMEINLIKI